MDQVQKERLTSLACSTTSKPTLCTIRCNDPLVKRVQWRGKWYPPESISEEPVVPSCQVGRLENEHTARGEQMVKLRQLRFRVGHVFDDLLQDDEIEALRWIVATDRRDRRLESSPLGRIDCGGVQIDAMELPLRPARALQNGEEAAAPATDVQDLARSWRGDGCNYGPCASLCSWAPGGRCRRMADYVRGPEASHGARAAPGAC
jgi:hypothetical protein